MDGIGGVQVAMLLFDTEMLLFDTEENPPGPGPMPEEPPVQDGRPLDAVAQSLRYDAGLLRELVWRSTVTTPASLARSLRRPRAAVRSALATCAIGIDLRAVSRAAPRSPRRACERRSGCRRSGAILCGP